MSSQLFKWSAYHFYNLSTEDLNSKLRPLAMWPAERRALRVIPKTEALRRTRKRETRALIKLDMVGVVEIEPDHLGRDIVPVQILRVMHGDDFEAKIPSLRAQADTYVDEAKRDPRLVGESARPESDVAAFNLMEGFEPDES